MNGIYIEEGPREKQLYANIGTDSLVAVLELDTDCHERVFTYFMRGGVDEGALSVSEYALAGPAFAELLSSAQVKWPRWFARRVED